MKDIGLAMEATISSLVSFFQSNFNPGNKNKLYFSERQKGLRMNTERMFGVL